MRMSQLQIHFLHWTAFVWWCIMEGGMPLWCHVPRLVKNWTTTHRYQNSFAISQGSFLYVIWTRGSRVRKIDGPILSARAQISEQHENGLCIEMFWARLGREGIPPCSKVAQKPRSGPAYEFLWSILCKQIFSKNRYVDYDIFLCEIWNRTKKSWKNEHEHCKKTS